MNDQRRLAPDTKWILGAMGAGFAAIIGITQYQLDQRAALTLERALSGQLTRGDMDEAFRPRDVELKKLRDEVTRLREERAKVGEALSNINTTLARIVDVSIQTQARAAQTEGQLNQLLKQTETNAALATQIVDRYQMSAQSLSERLTRLESQRSPMTPTGVP